MDKNAEISVTNRRILKLKMEGRSLKEIGQEVLPSVEWPAQSVANRLGRPTLRRRYAELLQERGLDDDSLIKCHRQLLKARDLKAIRIEGTRKKIGVKVPAWEARSRALHMIYALRGDYSPQTLELREAHLVQAKLLEALRVVTENCPGCRQALMEILAEEAPKPGNSQHLVVESELEGEGQD